MKSPPSHNSLTDLQNRLQSLDIDWSAKIKALKGPVYLTLDDAIQCLARNFVEEIGLSYKEKDIRRTVLILLNDSNEILTLLMTTLDIRELAED